MWLVLSNQLILFTFLLSVPLYFYLKPNHVKHLIYRQESVNITRDQYNVPTLMAQSYRSTLYAWGYVHAEDRLFQMAYKRVVVQGKLSEYLGAATIRTDKFLREINFGQMGKIQAERLRQENFTEYENYLAYASGINDYVAGLNFLPLDFQLLGLSWKNWTVADIFSLFSLFRWSQSYNANDEFVRSSLLGKGYTVDQVERMLPYRHEMWFNKEKEQAIVVAEAELPDQLKGKNKHSDRVEFTPVAISSDPNQLLSFEQEARFVDSDLGSNSWVISGAHTDTGEPINVNDPHLENCMPSEWYLLHFSYPYVSNDSIKTGIFDGGSMPGTPVAIGKTNYMSFSLTVLMGDTQDLYREKVKRNKYLVDGEWRPLQSRTEVIRVHGADSINYTVYHTHRGPLLHFFPHLGSLYQTHENLSLAWSGNFSSPFSYVLFSHLAQMDNFETVNSYLKYGSECLPLMVVLYSTNDGHIGLQSIGVNPLRRNQLSGMYVKDGTTTVHDWIGMVPAHQRLRVIDPPKGYLVAANNKPNNGSYYNGIYSFLFYTARANRIEQMIQERIAAGRKLGIHDMKEMLLDTTDVYCRKVIDCLVKVVDAQLLRGFNCSFSSQSSQATVYQRFWYEVYQLLAGRLHPWSMMGFHSYLAWMYNEICIVADNLNTQDVEWKKEGIDGSRNATLYRTAYLNTIKSLQQFFHTSNTAKWQWGKYHLDVMQHRPFGFSAVLARLYSRKVPGRGNIHTVNVGKMNRISQGMFETNHRANIRTIMSFHEDSFVITDGGSSERFYQKYYDDQLSIFSSDQYLSLSKTQNLSLSKAQSSKEKSRSVAQQTTTGSQPASISEQL